MLFLITLMKKKKKNIFHAQKLLESLIFSLKFFNISESLCFSAFVARKNSHEITKARNPTKNKRQIVYNFLQAFRFIFSFP